MNCVSCGKRVDVHPHRIKKNPNRRCMECYRKTVTHRQKSEGYIRVRGYGRGAKYEYEHRLVMEKKLGRPLKGLETVHHIDGDRSNNDPDNLALYDNPGEHVLEAGHVAIGINGCFEAS